MRCATNESKAIDYSTSLRPLRPHETSSGIRNVRVDDAGALCDSRKEIMLLSTIAASPGSSPSTEPSASWQREELQWPSWKLA